MEIKFHTNENIEWHCMQLELNPIPKLNYNILNSSLTKFNLNSIGLKLN